MDTKTETRLAARVVSDVVEALEGALSGWQEMLVLTHLSSRFSHRPRLPDQICHRISDLFQNACIRNMLTTTQFTPL
jgi:hypothetical protein